MLKGFFKTIKAHSPVTALLFISIMFIFGGCASNMTSYYSDLRKVIDKQDYAAAAKLVDKSKSVYGDKNILLYYLDYGTVQHFARNFDQSSKSFESAKNKFEENYTKSISAGAASMVFNDTALPYYGEDFERVYISVFESLNYVLSGEDNESVVEARQTDSLFKTFGAQSNYKNFYKDDGFIRYFMGLIYENAGYLNDAHISYYAALKAYKNGVVKIAPPQDLINDAYNSALALGFSDRAAEIKSSYPQAVKKNAPKGYGECIIIDYNGFIPKKIDNVIEFAFFDIWPYVSQTKIDDEAEAKEFQTAKSVTLSAFAKDYVKVAFPVYQDIPNEIKNFIVVTDVVADDGRVKKSYMAQDMSALAKKVLDDQKAKTYVKTLARAAVKYVTGKAVSKVVQDSTSSEGWGALTQIVFNVANSLSETADKRGWNTLPANILMSRFYLPEGENKITIKFRNADAEIVEEREFVVNINSERKNFIYLRSGK
ncbi:COG3014 family protein [Endomicrobium proavitum]|uniref:Lipoprotein n=1 Tax=Endomicrobium proavitum TaxID=1408281 RepID=A0A0G3WIC7_9BACT|nr:hypothetical protein [Endomicrobium proavitum]AKL97622.1 conserved exported protein of unknown function [Endomicrobium proavitum]